jgi:hypothetical protein
MSVAERVLRPRSLPERALRLLVDMWTADPEGFDEIAALLSMEVRPVYGSVTFTIVAGNIVASEVKATRKVAR